MYKLFSILALCLLCTACGNEGKKAERDINNVLEKVEDKAEVLADSAKEKFKDVRDHLDTALDRNRKDTLEKK
jgi:hypothetical protein